MSTNAGEPHKFKINEADDQIAVRFCQAKVEGINCIDGLRGMVVTQTCYSATQR